MLSFFQTSLYIQISPASVVMKNLKTGVTLAETPDVAITHRAGRSSIVGFGAEAHLLKANGQADVVINPFAHPRSMVSDFTVAQQLLKHLVRKSLGTTFLQSAPHVVMHPLGDPEGGFTQVEIRAFCELALGAGAAKVNIWTGRPLTDAEAKTRTFPHGAGVLH